MDGRVVMARKFSRSYHELDGSIKNRILDFIVKLQERPDATGLDLKTPEGARDRRVRTARVNDKWRAVLIELPESKGYVLYAVKEHDDAYAYAARLHSGVNEVTGALEVVDRATLDQAIQTAISGVGDPAAEPILAHVRPRQLRWFGIADDVAERLVTITDQDHLLTVIEELPEVQGEAVFELIGGQRTPEEVWADLIVEQEQVDPTDVVQALERPTSRLTFTDGRNTSELRAALEEDLEAWRVWLHPLQRRLAYHDGWKGPYRVTGGAGTGKTVTALHRAKHLAERLPDDTELKVLLTTFTKNLARTMQTQLRRLAGVELAKRVEVLHMDALAQRVLAATNEAGRRPTLRGDADKEVRLALERARDQVSSNWDVEFLLSEWNDVVLAQSIGDRQTYLKAPRSGRGRRISRPQRAEIWAIFERFTQALERAGIATFTQAVARAAAAAEQRARGIGRYQHAVVDEAQDLHPAHWKLLRAVVEEGNDDLFIVGDAHQRIYGKPLVLSRYGIETRGRSRRLTVNYRTSEQILRWSMRVASAEVDDLEGEPTSLRGARSLFQGPEPVFRGFDSPSDEADGLIEVLHEWSREGLRWSEMAVVARTRALRDDRMRALRDAGVVAVPVDQSTEDESALDDGVRMLTMHRAKGLEFRAVAVIGASADELPPASVRGMNGDEADAVWARERSLLYVCASRARERLAILWTGTPSELFPVQRPESERTDQRERSAVDSASSM